MSERQYPPLPRSMSTGGSVEVPAGGQTYYPPGPPGAGGSRGGPPGHDDGKFNRQAFVNAYASMVAQTWVDETLLQLILANPAETLANLGMPTIPGAVFRIVQCKLSGMGKVEDQVDAWVEGNRTGLYDLYLPMKPDELDIDQGGGAVGGVPCCCCTPCCCCYVEN